MQFTKYHALGNDYLVVDPVAQDVELNKDVIRVLCNRNYGFGSDGVLYGPVVNSDGDFSLRIFNPDGSEAEKSGNGLRIFARYLWDCGLVAGQEFTIATAGGLVSARVQDNGNRVSVNMGQVRFTHGPDDAGDATPERIAIDGKEYAYYRVSVGNPHCVVPVDALSVDMAKNIGSQIECASRFENRTNVQFMKVLNRDSIQIEIWERGAGYTLASGSSSTASAAVAHALGLCDQQISVVMPGGTIQIEIDEQFYATMTGPVGKIGVGELAAEALTLSSE